MNLKWSFKKLNKAFTCGINKKPFKLTEDQERCVLADLSSAITCLNNINGKLKRKIELNNRHRLKLMKLREIYDKKFIKSFSDPKLKNIDIEKEVEKLDKKN